MGWATPRYLFTQPNLSQFREHNQPKYTHIYHLRSNKFVEHGDCSSKHASGVKGAGGRKEIKDKTKEITQNMKEATIQHTNTFQWSRKTKVPMTRLVAVLCAFCTTKENGSKRRKQESEIKWTWIDLWDSKQLEFRCSLCLTLLFHINYCSMGGFCLSTYIVRAYKLFHGCRDGEGAPLLLFTTTRRISK